MTSRIAEVTKIAAPVTDYIRLADGTATPTSGTAGYCKGCLFINTTDGKVYVNNGTSTACAFAELVS